jgi:hypothetical protein
MVDIKKRPKLVGLYLKQHRETKKLSQKSLGLLFTPPVTTQFISNVERGITPLPPTHVPIISKALDINENELLELLAKEYAIQLSGKVNAGEYQVQALSGNSEYSNLLISKSDFSFLKNLYEAYSSADSKSKAAFITVCETILNIPKPPGIS